MTQSLDGTVITGERLDAYWIGGVYRLRPGGTQGPCH